MFFIVTAENRSLFAAEIAEMHRQRKRVFVDGFGWKIPVVSDMEIDRYDRNDTIYLIAKAGPQAAVTASVRLLPTVGPHLMSDLFRTACGGSPPCGSSIWEVSRFCIAPEVPSRRSRIGLLWEVICGITETALLFGIERVTFQSNAALLPLVLDCGWSAQPLGPSLPDGDDQITAVTASITADGLRNVRQRFGVPRPVTRFVISNCSPAIAQGATSDRDRQRTTTELANARYSQGYAQSLPCHNTQPAALERLRCIGTPRAG
jgi:acyl-homoserine lactone synthase